MSVKRIVASVPVRLAPLANAGHELLDLVEKCIDVPGDPEMVVALQLDEAGVRDVLRQIPATAHRDHPIPGSVQDERLRANRRQDVPDIELWIEPEEASNHPRACCGALISRPFLTSAWVVDEARCPRLQADAVPPTVDHGVELLQAGGVDADRKVGCTKYAREGAVEHERRRPLGIRCRKQCGHRASLGDPEDCRPLASGRVHDCEKVVRSFLERRRARDGVRQARAALVEEHEATERRQTLVAPRQQRILPRELHMRNETRRKYEIHRPTADHLVGNADLAGVRVSGRGSHQSKESPMAADPASTSSWRTSAGLSCAGPPVSVRAGGGRRAFRCWSCA